MWEFWNGYCIALCERCLLFGARGRQLEPKCLSSKPDDLILFGSPSGDLEWASKYWWIPVLIQKIYDALIPAFVPQDRERRAHGVLGGREREEGAPRKSSGHGLC